MRRVIRAIAVLLLAPAIAAAVMTGVFAVTDPVVSALMLWRLAQGNGVEFRPVPVTRISPELIHAVLTSEDNRFCVHHGIDWQAVGTAIEEADDGGPRGASTITMQTVKNLFLWPERSYVRKAIEAPLALLADLVWTKRRTIELYLNFAEWGSGLYGAEAAARRYFGRSAADLTRGQAALMAAALPAPQSRSAGRPGAETRRIAARIEQRMDQTRGLFGCVEEAP